MLIQRRRRRTARLRAARLIALHSSGAYGVQLRPHERA
jgi:hypothetical protein